MKRKVVEEMSAQFVLLRGLARESRHWGEFPELLSAAFPGSRVKGLDLPGTGIYSEMRSPVSIAKITEFVREKFLEMRQRQREMGETPATECHLIAVSLGGMVAAEWLSRWSSDFKTATMINTSFKGLSPIHHRLSLGAYQHLLLALLGKTPLEREAHVLRMVSNRKELHAETAKKWAEIQLSRPVGLENFGRQLLAAARFEPELRLPAVPILILNSARDHMVHPACSKEIAKHWNTSLHCHPTAGHDLPLDEPGWVVEQIKSWLTESVPSARRA